MEDKKKQVTVLFGKKDDKTLLEWVTSVPSGLFSYYALEAIEKQNDEGYTLPKFSHNNKVKSSIAKTISFKNNAKLFEDIARIDPYLRGQYIKKAISKALDVNKRKDNERDSNINNNIINSNSTKDISIDNNINNNFIKNSSVHSFNGIESVKQKKLENLESEVIVETENNALNVLLQMAKNQER